MIMIDGIINTFKGKGKGYDKNRDKVEATWREDECRIRRFRHVDVKGSSSSNAGDDDLQFNPEPQLQSLSQWQWRSQSLSLARGQGTGEGQGQLQGSKRRRQPSVPLPAFSFPQAPASAPAPDAAVETETDAAPSSLSGAADEATTPTSTSNTTLTSATTSLFPTATNCFAPAADVSPPSTSYSTTSSNISPFTSPPPSRQQHHQRQQARRQSHTPSLSISSPPPPSSSSSSTTGRRHAHRRSAAMSGIDADAVASLANMSSFSSSASSSIALGSPVSRPVSIHANIPQIVLNGEPASAGTTITTPTVTGDDNNGGNGGANASGMPGIESGGPPFRGRTHHTLMSSNLSIISSEGSLSLSTEASTPTAETAPESFSPTTPRHTRPKTFSFADLLRDASGASEGENLQHRRAQSTDLRRSCSGSTQRTIKAGVDGLVAADDEANMARSEEQEQERPVSSSNSKAKAAKKQKKVRAWAGILTRKSKKKQVPGNNKKQQQQPPSSSQSQFQGSESQDTQLNALGATSGSATSSSEGPPPSEITTSEPTLTRSNSFSDDSSDFEINFDDDHTIVIQSSACPEEEYDSSASNATTAVSSFESAWKPRSFYEQGRQLNNDENPFSPVIDLDAALGPFRTPEVSDSGSGFSFATKHMHSGRGRKNEFLSPENRHHRRAESAPAIQPLEQARNCPVAMAMQYSAAAIFKTPDVFDEEEEDAFLARTTEKDAKNDCQMTEKKKREDEEQREDKDDDSKSFKSFRSFRSFRDRSSLRWPGSRVGRALPPGGRSLRIDTSRASSPFRVQQSESGTSLSESENPVSPISIGRPLHQFPAPENTASMPETALSATEENADQQAEATPELLSPTPKSQYTSLFSSPSTSSFSITDYPRNSLTFVAQDHRSSNGSLLLPAALGKQGQGRADSPVDNLTNTSTSTPPTSTFDVPFAPSPSSSSTFSSNPPYPPPHHPHHHHSNSRFAPPTASASPAPAAAFHHRSTTNESMSMTMPPSMSSPTLRPVSRSRHKRSSIVSLSKLITASHATERNRPSLDERPPGSAAGGIAPPASGVPPMVRGRMSCDGGYKERKEEAPPVAKSHRISRLMQFWRTRDKDGRSDD
ncbi:hypothetical protein KEM56_007130 [Ascosphaera pollenicola]|nr:hypothetical protein KEM56_007130 [Ascosphaera pollenicola]